jgi:PBP1b-binding outer membrane lipoprotein LpoB
MNSIIYASVLTAIIFLTGCAAHQTQPMGGIRAPKIEVAGSSKQELLACAGAPVRHEREEGVEYLTYFTAPAATSGGLLQTMKARRLSCEATIIIRNNTVEKIEYRDGTGEYTEPEQCAPIFERCKK